MSGTKVNLTKGASSPLRSRPLNMHVSRRFNQDAKKDYSKELQHTLSMEKCTINEKVVKLNELMLENKKQFNVFNKSILKVRQKTLKSNLDMRLNEIRNCIAVEHKQPYISQVKRDGSMFPKLLTKPPEFFLKRNASVDIKTYNKKTLSASQNMSVDQNDNHKSSTSNVL